MNDYYSLLGVERQATAAEIANAYRQLLLRERQEKGAEADFGLYSQAYRTLSVPAKRQEYDRLLDRLAGRYVIKNQESPTEAEKCYLAGLTCLEQKNFQDAVDYLSRAVQLEPEESHFCSQLGLALGMFSDKLAEAERYCKQAIELDPDNPDFYFNLGFLYQRHNLVDAAQTAFDQANQAIKKREARILGQGQPLITPWEGHGQNLMEELARIESLVEEMGEGSGQKIPTAEPEAAAEAASGNDLLEEINKIELKMAEVESQVQAQATAGEEPVAEQEPVVSEGSADWSLGESDLLKELDLLEAQVRGVEELHNGEIDKQTQDSAATEAGLSLESEPTPSPSFSLPEEYRSTESFKLAEEAQPSSAVAATPPEPSEQIALTEERPPHGPISPEAGIQESVLPEALGEPAVLERAVELMASPAGAEEQAGSEVGSPAGERPQAEPPAAEMKAPETGFPSLPAREKLRMLEELEREMMSELDRLRMEKRKIMEAVQS